MRRETGLLIVEERETGLLIVEERRYRVNGGYRVIGHWSLRDFMESISCGYLILIVYGSIHDDDDSYDNDDDDDDDVCRLK